MRVLNLVRGRELICREEGREDEARDCAAITYQSGATDDTFAIYARKAELWMLLVLSRYLQREADGCGSKRSNSHGPVQPCMGSSKISRPA